jgi:Ribosomal protein L35Ae
VPLFQLAAARFCANRCAASCVQVIRKHGSIGTVRAKFQKNLPPKALVRHRLLLCDHSGCHLVIGVQASQSSLHHLPLKCKTCAVMILLDTAASRHHVCSGWACARHALPESGIAARLEPQCWPPHWMAGSHFSEGAWHMLRLPWNSWTVRMQQFNQLLEAEHILLWPRRYL